MSEKKLFCTAGSSFMMFYPNGDVYRCMRDYNTNEKPIFNLKDTNYKVKYSKKAQICNQRFCNTSCDADWSTKFLYENNELKKTYHAQEWGGVSHKNYWKNQNPVDEVDFISIIFTPTLPCNYTCNYCGCAAGVNKIKEVFSSVGPEMKIEEWIKTFDNIIQDYNKVHIQTNGGEPLLSEATIPVIKRTAEHCSVNMVSNISVKISDLINANIKPYDLNSGTGFQLTASLHPTSKNWIFEPFLGKLLLLKNHGYLRGVNFVAWPGQIYLFDYFKEIFAKYDIKIWLQPWVGPDNFGYKEYAYPEKEYLLQRADNERSIEKQYDFSEYVQIPSQHSNCKLLDKKTNDEEVTYFLEYENTGKTKWTKDDNIKFGCKILDKKVSLFKSSFELRRDLDKNINTGEKVKVSFNIKKLILEKYKLDNHIIFDVVKEGKFWFQELGSKVFEEKII